MTDALATYLADAGPGSLVVVESGLADWGLGDLVPAGAGAVIKVPGELPPEKDRWDAVTLLVADRIALRELMASGECPDLGRARRIAVWFATGPGLTPAPAPGWPRLVAARSRRLAERSWLSILRFGAATQVRAVFAELARQSAVNDTTGNGGLWTSTAVPASDSEIPADVILYQHQHQHQRRAQHLPQSRAPAQQPDRRGATAAADPLPSHPVLGRPPVVLGAPVGPDLLGPLDERCFNPIGFVGAATAPPGALPPRTRLSLASVRDLRGATCVWVPWPEHLDEVLARTVAGLAMCGVPLTSRPPPPWAADLLGPAVVAALGAPIAEDDVLAREEHSIVLRRAALDTFSTRSWRRRTASAAGVRIAGELSVSVVLATRRPDMLEFALSQVARQRGLEVELVLASHGFEVDETWVQDQLGDVRLVLAPQPGDTAFGDVLNTATLAASGELILKMDDDDWYGPDVIADLVRAHAYSGAQVVGMPAEFHYLTEPDLTVARGHTSEVYARFVAGGTLMIERALLREVGGYRSACKFVDAQLLSAVAAAGGVVYRAHGLGYVLRRNPTGHTWQVDLDYLLDPSRVSHTWEGFRPSRLLENSASGSQR